jgi:hypothetical protein
MLEKAAFRHAIRAFRSIDHASVFPAAAGRATLSGLKSQEIPFQN